MTAILDGKPLSQALANATAGLAAPERGLARAAVMSACKNWWRVGRTLNAYLDRPPKHRQVLALLHLGAAELLSLNTPDHAAVNSYVSLTRRTRTLATYKNLVNAILRRIIREREAIEATPCVLALPDWLRESWEQAYGAESCRKMAESMLTEPGLDLCLRDEAIAGPILAEREGFVPAPGMLRLADPAGLQELPGYHQGRWWVQDLSAQLPARLFGDPAGRQIADFCAAPGGKTMQLAAAGAEVTAYDISERRLRRLQDNLARTGLKARVEVRDLAENPPEETFDAILLDAPCSATGTLRRNPDVMLHRSPEDVESLVALQQRLLQAAVTSLKPGGILVYSVCSLEPAEGEDQIAWALEHLQGLRLDPIVAEELPLLPDGRTKQGTLRILPHMLSHENPRLSGVDGFFAARLRR